MPRDADSRWRFAALALGVVWGCYSPGVPPLNEEMVIGRLSWPDVGLAPLEYRRVADQPYVGAYFVLISELGHYCVVTSSVYTRAREQERWACDWRPARPERPSYGRPTG